MDIIREENWIHDGEYEWAAYVDLTVAQIAAINNLVPAKWEEDGLGEVEGLFLRDSTGRQLIVAQYLDNPDPVWAKRTEIAFVRDNLTLYEAERVAARMMSELEISIDKLVMFYDGLDEERVKDTPRVDTPLAPAP